MYIQSKTQSNGRANLYMGPRLLLGPIYRVCSTTPRFSYPGPETCVTGYEHGSGTVRGRVREDGYGTGWVQAGWVYRVGTREGYTGTYPARCCEEDPRSTQRSGPVAPCRGAEWWGAGSGDYPGDGGGDGSCTTLRARSVHPWWPSLYRTLRMPPYSQRGEN